MSTDLSVRGTLNVRLSEKQPAGKVPTDVAYTEMCSEFNVIKQNYHNRFKHKKKSNIPHPLEILILFVQYYYVHVYYENETHRLQANVSFSFFFPLHQFCAAFHEVYKLNT
jgi:hypothetical protein